MEFLLLWVGRLAALGGVLLCAWSAYARLTNTYYAAGFQTGTLLMGGIALMVAGCVCFLVILTGRSRR